MRPVFDAGDALIFDHLNLHRTAIDPGMTRDRHAIETWLFSPSTYDGHDHRRRRRVLAPGSDPHRVLSASFPDEVLGERVELDVERVVLGDAGAEGVADLDRIGAVHMGEPAEVPAEASMSSAT